MQTLMIQLILTGDMLTYNVIWSYILSGHPFDRLADTIGRDEGQESGCDPANDGTNRQ